MEPIERIRTALLNVTSRVHRYFALNEEPPYLVWSEERAPQLWADDKPTARIYQGTIDYFTRDEDDPDVPRIEAALTGTCISWTLNSVQYEEDTGLIHYEWNWETV